MSIESSFGNTRNRRRYGDKQTDTSPERPRLGGDEHPNNERPGARPHPAMRGTARVSDRPSAR